MSAQCIGALCTWAQPPARMHERGALSHPHCERWHVIQLHVRTRHWHAPRLDAVTSAQAQARRALAPARLRSAQSAVLCP